MQPAPTQLQPAPVPPLPGGPPLAVMWQAPFFCVFVAVQVEVAVHCWHSVPTQPPRSYEGSVLQVGVGEYVVLNVVQKVEVLWR